MKVIDVFPFFNELDILEIRLNILDPYVDCFILSEATKTFSGLDKPLYYQENKDRFESLIIRSFTILLKIQHHQNFIHIKEMFSKR
jgi:beta-1,4-mannosyl-glycoprotein beta-1,4-N-acetylglucosaminyltransferase